jgi:hypothetical protein
MQNREGRKKSKWIKQRGKKDLENRAKVKFEAGELEKMGLIKNRNEV